MAENVKDDRLAEMDRIFKINNPNYKSFYFGYKDVHFTSIREVDGFYVASSIEKRDIKKVHYDACYDSKGECGKSLYFILPKNNKQSKGVVIDMESHPWHEWDCGILEGSRPAFIEIGLNVEGKEVARVLWKNVYIDVADTLSVRQFLVNEDDRGTIRKFFDKFVVDEEERKQREEEVRKQRREDIKVIKDGVKEKVGRVPRAIKNKIEHIKSRCRSIHDRIEENREQAKENRRVEKIISSYIRPGGRNS